MKISISEVFDATKHPHYHVYGAKNENKTPWTFIISIGNFQFLPSTDIASCCDYSTKEEVEEARKGFKVNKNTVAVVTKNSDFTEGRGPMSFHKVFKDPSDAHNYVISKEGIYGSKQEVELRFGCNVNNELYGSFNYNGYDIYLTLLE